MSNINTILDFSFLNTLHQFDSVYPYLRNNPTRSITNANLFPSSNITNSVFQDIVSNRVENLLLSNTEDPYELSTLYDSFLNEPTSTKMVLSTKGEKQLKKIKYNKQKCKNSECPITQVKFTEEEEITQLPCQHCFHTESIHRWLTTEKAACPVCRYNLDSVVVSNTTNEVVDNQLSYNNMGIGQYYSSYIEEILRRYGD